MGSGASVRSQREQEEVEDDGEMFGLRGKKFRLKNNPVLMGTKMKKRKCEAKIYLCTMRFMMKSL